MWEADKFFPILVSTVLVVIIIVILIKKLIAFTINYSKFDENEQTDEKIEIKKDKGKGWRIFWKTILFFALGAFCNVFGLIAWLIIFFCWKGENKSKNNQTTPRNKYQELYYKELYEKQKRENEKQLVQENQKENSE